MVNKKIYGVTFEDRTGQREIYFLSRKRAEKFIKFPVSNALVYNSEPEKLYFIADVKETDYINIKNDVTECYYSYNDINIDKYGEIEFAYTYEEAISKFGKEYHKGILLIN